MKSLFKILPFVNLAQRERGWAREIHTVKSELWRAVRIVPQAYVGARRPAIPAMSKASGTDRRSVGAYR